MDKFPPAFDRVVVALGGRAVKCRRCRHRTRRTLTWRPPRARRIFPHTRVSSTRTVESAMSDAPERGFLARMLGAAMLRGEVYGELARGRGAMGQVTLIGGVRVAGRQHPGLRAGGGVDGVGGRG